MEKREQKLFSRDFTLVVVGQIISLFGNAILRFALPLYLLRETGSSTLFGLVNASAFVPMVVFTLVGGVLADRLHKRNIMVILDFSTAILILGFYLLHGRIPLVPLMIVCLMMLYGILGTYQPTVQASIPVLLNPGQITRGNAVINMVSTLSGLLGPVIGGLLFGTWGIVPILLISIACFFSSAVMEIFIRIPHQKQEKQGTVVAIITGDLRESWRYVRVEKPALFSEFVVLALFNLVLTAALSVGIPVMVVNILGMTDAELGVTQGTLGLGGLVGGILTGLLGERLKLNNSHWLLALCSLTVAGMAMGVLPFVPRMGGYLLITIMGFLGMVACAMLNIQICSAIQRHTPPHLIGKVMALGMAISSCASPLGQAAYGVLYDVLADMPWIVGLGAAIISLFISLYSRGAFARLEGSS